jgi:hypothetical protein
MEFDTYFARRTVYTASFALHDGRQVTHILKVPTSGVAVEDV